MRYLLVLIVCLSLSTQSTHAIIMTSWGIETPQGTIKWEEFIKLPSEVETLRKALFIGSSVIVGYIAYQLWKEYKSSKKELKMPQIDPITEERL